MSILQRFRFKTSVNPTKNSILNQCQSYKDLNLKPVSTLQRFKFKTSVINFLVKTKKIPKDLKNKITANCFLNGGFPKGGGEIEKNSKIIPFFFSATPSAINLVSWKREKFCCIEKYKERNIIVVSTAQFIH